MCFIFHINTPYKLSQKNMPGYYTLTDSTLNVIQKKNFNRREYAPEFSTSVLGFFIFYYRDVGKKWTEKYSVIFLLYYNGGTKFPTKNIFTVCLHHFYIVAHTHSFIKMVYYVYTTEGRGKIQQQKLLLSDFSTLFESIFLTKQQIIIVLDLCMSCIFYPSNHLGTLL